MDTVYANGGSGALFWILSGKQDDGTLYPDYDGATVYCPSAVCTTIGNFSRKTLDPAATAS
jgi:mannan endo-1,4-beta-mannosidase